MVIRYATLGMHNKGTGHRKYEKSKQEPTKQGITCLSSTRGPSTADGSFLAWGRRHVLSNLLFWLAWLYLENKTAAMQCWQNALCFSMQIMILSTTFRCC
mmetsp:Transcript_46086/g.111653  ORF Transcript_46086/g.111653 Transcript_46086/m.111653 type:complete len:100 (+) Transcript_46086:57-356(+)